MQRGVALLIRTVDGSAQTEQSDHVLTTISSGRIKECFPKHTRRLLLGARWEFRAAKWTCLLKTETPKALDAFPVESMIARESNGVIRTQFLETYRAILEAFATPLFHVFACAVICMDPLRLHRYTKLLVPSFFLVLDLTRSAAIGDGLTSSADFKCTPIR